MRYVWLTFGWVFVLLGAAGIILPLLPTTPFLLLAAFSFSRGSPRLYNWLIEHAHLGPPVRQWQRHGAIATKFKWMAMIFILASVGLSFVYGVPFYAFVVQVTILTGVSFFILTRPAPPSEQREKG